MNFADRAQHDSNVRATSQAPEIWGARLPVRIVISINPPSRLTSGQVLKNSPKPAAVEAAPGALQWLLSHTVGWQCGTPVSTGVPGFPGMVGTFELTGTTPITHEFQPAAATTLLTGFTSLRMSPRKTGIKVALTRKPIDENHITFALDTTRAPDSATCTFLNPARCGPSAQHGTVDFSSVNTEQPPPLSIVIPFTHAFTSTPQVVVWLNSLDFVTGSKLAVETRAANVTPSGFTLFVTGLMDLPRAGNTVSWIAFEASPHIVSGTFVFGKGSSYASERWSASIASDSEMFMAFNTFSGPPDSLQYMAEAKVSDGCVSVTGSSVSKALCSTGVAYIVFPRV